MDGDQDDLLKRQASLEETQRQLSALDDLAVADKWTADERASLADERDAVADEVDAVAISFDDRAERRDENARSREVLTNAALNDELANPGQSDAAVYGRYLAARDRDGAAADRVGAAGDRRRSATRRQVAADGRRRSAAHRDEAAIARVIADAEATPTEDAT